MLAGTPRGSDGGRVSLQVQNPAMIRKAMIEAMKTPLALAFINHFQKASISVSHRSGLLRFCGRRRFGKLLHVFGKQEATEHRMDVKFFERRPGGLNPDCA